MSIVKHFVCNAIEDNPSRYGVDNGDLNLINDFFEAQGWEPITREQHVAIAALIRYRNYFLQENEAYDHRAKQTAYVHTGQTDIFDFMDDATALQSKKLIRYWSADPIRIDYTNSRIRKSVRGVDDEHIIAARIMYPLLASNPRLKPKRRQRKAPNYRASNNVFIGDVETFEGVTGI